MIDATLIEQPAAFTGAGRISLGGGFADADLRRRFSRRETTGGCANRHLREVVIDTQTALVFSGGEVLEFSCLLPEATDLRSARQRIMATPLPVAGRVFMGINRVALNHFHWLTQCVPAIAGYALDPGFAGGTLLLLPLASLHHRALELAGVRLPAVHEVASLRPLAIADLTYSTLLTQNGGQFSLFCRDLYARMAANASGPPIRAAAHRRIYVWRIDTPSRPMRNEDELVERLAHYGIEPVITSTLTIDEQIILFRDSALVVGGHGAGMANIVFCRPGAIVYELLPSHWTSPAMNHLAQLSSLDYWGDIHPAEARPGLWRHQTPWSVDIDAVERRIEAILAQQECATVGVQ